MLTVSGLVAGYPGGGRVLEGVDLRIAPGEAVALLGRNGMGKTTLLRAIMGHLRIEAGRLVFGEHDITGWPPFAVSNAGLAYVPQGREIFKDFTVEENLLLGLLGRKSLDKRVPDAIYARFPLLAERRGQKAGTMSGGEQQQLAIARAIVSRPRLLLLDEPSEGIQPSIVHALTEVLDAVAREGQMGLLIVEQNLELVLALTRRCLFMQNGRIVDEMPTPRLREAGEALERYLSI
jgi:branched-chain amino acid transport system ATP-binding protein/urea transport system ATP-binding protein